MSPMLPQSSSLFSIVLIGAAWEIATSNKRIARSKFNFMMFKEEGSNLWYGIKGEGKGSDLWYGIKGEGSVLWFGILKVVVNEDENAIKIREYLYCRIERSNDNCDN
ncbi:1635_t:CDS:2, partial [Rhizophagus irregularis]